MLSIVDGYAAGTRFGIRMDDDGLLAAGVPGVQLTWMDARVGDRVITPRIGKPVEIQALWLNALQRRRTVQSCVAGAAGTRPRGVRRALLDRARLPRRRRGRRSRAGHARRAPSARIRFSPSAACRWLIVEGDRARRVVDAVEARLFTPMGLRSLAPGEPGYAARYEGDSAARDAVYHQGTVWPWLIGPFVDAWLRVRSNTVPIAPRRSAAFSIRCCAAYERGGSRPRVGDRRRASRRSRRVAVRSRRGRSAS